MGPFSGSASSTSKWPCSGNVSTCPRGRMRTCSTKLWRWLPEDLGSFYVTVNVPEFMLRVMAEGKPIFTARVVVGAPDTQTPIFSQEMQEIVFNPLCQTQSRQRRSRPISRKLEATRSSGVADGIPIFSKAPVFASISGATRSIPSKLDWGRVLARDLA